MSILVLLLLCFDAFILKETKYVEFPINCFERLGYCTIPVFFGTNCELFNLQIDTTTSDTWIPSIGFDLNVSKYNISNSKSGILKGQTIEIYDEEGTILGKTGFDFIRLENIIITNYGFALAYGHDKKFKDYPYGKLGLGYYQEKENFHFLQKLKENNKIDRRIFIIDSFEKKLIIGKIPSYLLDLPSESCSLIDVSSLGKEYRHSWACEIYKIFCGVEIVNKVGFTLDKDGNPIPFEYKAIDFDNSKDAYEPAIFDSAYPYLRFPIKYLDYIKGNLIRKYLKGSCTENVDEDSSIYFVCKKNFINLSNSYLQLFINRKMFYILGSDLFRSINYFQYELLIRFSQKTPNVLILGQPFFNNWATVYD